MFVHLTLIFNSFQDLTWECGCFLAAAPPGTSAGSQQHFVNAVIQQIRTQPYLTSLAQKCYQVLEKVHKSIFLKTHTSFVCFFNVLKNC